jgi:3,4-dihydroxyphenylacetate 2,3-dioxygenase
VLDYDTVVVLDSHWHTTVEFVVAAQATRAGLFTSDELPRGMSRIPYDWPGDPELAHAIAAQADAHGTWITAIGGRAAVGNPGRLTPGPAGGRR